jgi:acyl-CoA thioester hydrolase
VSDDPGEPTGLIVRHRVHLRLRDIDPLGHLTQSVYHEILEEGRCALWSELSRRTGGDGEIDDCVLARVEMDYRSEVRHAAGAVDVVVWVRAVGTSSLRIGYELRRPDGGLAACGVAVMVAWDPQARGKRPFTDDERAWLSSDQDLSL